MRLLLVARRALAAGAWLALAVQCSREPEASALVGARPAQRIVPVSATAVDMVCALVVPERIAGLPAQALEYSTLHDADGALRARVKFDAYEAEPVLALEPDLVVIDPWQAPETTERLRDAGLRVLVLPEIPDWTAARATLEMLGRELDEPGRASALVAELDARVEALRANAAQRTKWRALCYSNFGASGSTAGARTTIDAMMRLAGLVNVIAEGGASGHVGIGFEELLTLDPDLILVSQPLRMEPGQAGDRGGASEKLLYAEPSLAGLRAVREKRIVALPAWLFATGSHEIVRGAEVLAGEVDALRARLQREGRH
jgi:iron complex transport system substrate-binding protein